MIQFLNLLRNLKYWYLFKKRKWNFEYIERYKEFEKLNFGVDEEQILCYFRLFLKHRFKTERLCTSYSELDSLDNQMFEFVKLIHSTDESGMLGIILEGELFGTDGNMAAHFHFRDFGNNKTQYKGVEMFFEWVGDVGCCGANEYYNFERPNLLLHVSTNNNFCCFNQKIKNFIPQSYWETRLAPGTNNFLFLKAAGIVKLNISIIFEEPIKIVICEPKNSRRWRKYDFCPPEDE